MLFPFNQQNECAMFRSYHFKVHDNGTEIEELGDMELRGDAEALTFGKLVIKELIHKDVGYYSTGHIPRPTQL
jgi:hypothetical protein